MSRVLSVANKLLSLRGAVEITDGYGKMAYRGKGEFALLSPTWRVFRGDTPVGSVRRRVLSWRPTWDIKGELGDFRIMRKLLSFRRRYYTVGGPVDGATVTGNFLDLRYEVSRAGKSLAKARGRILTLRDRHEVEVLDEPELFVIFAMLVVQMDRAHERHQKSLTDDD